MDREELLKAYRQSLNYFIKTKKPSPYISAIQFVAGLSGLSVSELKKILFN